MNKILKHFLHTAVSLIALIFISLSMTSCTEENNEPDIPGETGDMTLLIYAVASNNLSYDLKSDMNEIYEAANQIKGLNKSVNVLLYYVLPGNDYATLSRLEADSDYYSFKKVKGYDRKLYSTDPVRIRQVIDDAAKISPATKNGIVFWSHGTGWSPSFSSHSITGSKNAPANSESGSSDLIKSFGADQYMYQTDNCDIDELAAAIPENRFDFIWFDCCYMSGIELIYQLRNKCDYLVAYPTEIMAEGMPYHLTLPFLANGNPDLLQAAKTLYNYYIDKNQIVTVLVADMANEKIERLADISKTILKNAQPVNADDMYIYSRYNIGPFYDLKQFLVASIPPEDDNRESLIEELDNALNDIILLKGYSQYDFRGVEIPVDEVTAISSHIPGVMAADKEAYYKTLDWWKRVYEQ